MRIGVFQFHGNNDASQNHTVIMKAIMKAKKNKVRLLVFQECATCGYPPVETPDIRKINFDYLELKLQEIINLAGRYDMYIAIGTIRKKNTKYYNSLQVVSPSGELMGNYDKRALWGWDVDNFERGTDLGIYQIDDLKVGFRICFEVRFPEYFRELYKANVPLCFVSFCDVSEQDLTERYDIIKSHLITRAVENIMTVVSVNSISNYQTAPTAVIDQNGHVVLEAPRNKEHLLIYEYNIPEVTFGMEGRIKNSNVLLHR